MRQLSTTIPNNTAENMRGLVSVSCALFLQTYVKITIEIDENN